MYKYIIVTVTILIVLAAIVVVLAIRRSMTKTGSLKFHHIGKTKFKFELKPILKNIFGPTSLVQNNQTLYITTKTGKLWSITGGKRTLIIDMEKDVPKFTFIGEGGLMCIVLDPEFDKNKELYLSYTTEINMKDYIMRLNVDHYELRNNKFKKLDNIISIGCRQAIHHAGTIQFFKGYLYLSTGDTGPQKDPFNEAQNPKSLLGKILRIDVNTKEVKMIALGLRNPWRFSITEEGKMFIGDVGLATWEMVYLIPDLNARIPYNFSWNYFEGYSKRIRKSKKKPSDFDPPIFQYHNGKDTGRAVIGGYFLEEYGIYIFGDYIGILRALQYNKLKGYWERVAFQRLEKEGILSFGTYKDTLYVLGRQTVYILNVKNV